MKYMQETLSDDMIEATSDNNSYLKGVIQLGESMNEEIRLPEAFTERMERLLKEEYSVFLSSYEKERHYGLRCNLLKGTAENFAERMPFVLERVSWAEEGFYYQAKEQPGRNVLHEAGAYYIQEPSAMAVAEILDPQPGERILDLCAAPGGKSTQIACRMGGRGLLVANEIMSDRAKILSQNVERMGVTNCVVCNEKPERMAALFPAFFDRILVDAPCSGEGMFRKDETARQEWSLAHVKMCADRQAKILAEAAKMLRPGGVLVYSTCTFAPEENEGTVSAFVQAHDDFIIEETDCDRAFLGGRKEWIEDPVQGIEHTMRLWPHQLKGEGHYIARLRRKGEPVERVMDDENADRAAMEQVSSLKAGKGRGGIHKKGQEDKKLGEEMKAFLTKELGITEMWLENRQGMLSRFGEQICLIPQQMIPLTGVKVLRPGLSLVMDRKNRFEPAHALALALSPEDTDRTRDLTREEAERYIRGETISCGQERGWILLIYMGYPVGFGKASGGQIKNHYPKGLRRNI